MAGDVRVLHPNQRAELQNVIRVWFADYAYVHAERYAHRRISIHPVNNWIYLRDHHESRNEILEKILLKENEWIAQIIFQLS